MISFLLITLAGILALNAKKEWRLVSCAIFFEFLLSYLTIHIFEGEGAFAARVYLCFIAVTILYLKKAPFVTGALYAVAAIWNLGAFAAYHFEIFINFYFSYTPIMNTLSVLLLFYQFWIAEFAERIFYGWRKDSIDHIGGDDFRISARIRLGGDA